MPQILPQIPPGSFPRSTGDLSGAFIQIIREKISHRKIFFLFYIEGMESATGNHAPDQISPEKPRNKGV